MASSTRKFSWRRFGTGALGAFSLAAFLPLSAATLNQDGGTGFFHLESAVLPEYTQLGLSFYNRILNMNTGVDAFNSVLQGRQIVLPDGTVRPATLFSSDHELAASIASLRFIEAHVAVPLYYQDLNYTGDATHPDGETQNFVAGDLRYGFKLAMPLGAKNSPLAVALLFGGSLPTSQAGSIPVPRRIEYIPAKASLLTQASTAAGTMRDDWHIGAALTLDLEHSAMPLPVQIHANAGARKTSALTPDDADYFDILESGVGFQGFLSQYASLLGEYWHENRMEQIPNDQVSLDDISLGLAFHTPIGLSFIIGGAFALNNSEATPYVFNNENSQPVYGFNVRTSSDAQIILAVTYTSRGPQDRDHDGILDQFDKCPDQPEDKDGFEDEDGCPDPDNDKDGILDIKDKCPNDPEDFDGFEDEDGCPDPDNDKDSLCDPWVIGPVLIAKYASVCHPTDKCPNDPQGPDGKDGCPNLDKDGDGIMDKDDKCPNDPEDKDGFEDEDGCPDPDNDKDGLCDPWVAEKGQSAKYAAVCKGSDKCPNEPETVNGFQDDDGCPDVAPVEQKTLILRGVNFETGKASLLPESFAVLDDIAAQLVAAPKIEVEVSGHTDNRSGYEFNMKLSQERAQTVASYLISKGVDASRLKVVGYGYNKPIASNRTAEGRLQNRRVEFNRIK